MTALTTRPHVPFRGIDDRWSVGCPKRGVARVVVQHALWYCGGCGARLEEPDA